MVRFDQLTAADFLEKPIRRRLEPMVPDVDPKRELVLQVVKAHLDGVRTSEVAAALEQSSISLAPNTLLKLLRGLEHDREVYSRAGPRGGPRIWYPNGRLIHPFLELYREIRGKTYRITVQDARSGPAIQIQERSYSLLTGDHVEGAIFIEYDSLDELTEMLNEIKSRYSTFNTTKVKR